MRRISVFARPPVTGRVKTRLSPALTPVLACRLYRAMLEDTIAAAARARADERWIHWSETPAVETAPALSDDDERLPHAGADFRTGIQCGEDLGARLAAAFRELLTAP